MNTEAQTVAVSWKLVRHVEALVRSGGGQRTIQMPAWAIIAVPRAVNVNILLYGMHERSTEDEVELNALSILL